MSGTAAPASAPRSATEEDTASVVRWGFYSVALNVVLIALHGLVAAASGSLAVTAELLHNTVDLASAAIVLLGVRLAMRRSRAFPYGLYKIENLVAAGLALMIFLTAYEVVGGALLEAPAAPSVDAWMLALLAATMALPLVFSHFEMRVARRTNSPALLADAREYRIHAYTTGLAFAALLSAWFDLPLDRIAAAIIVVAVAKTGWDLLADALRVLLDASLDPASLAEIRKVIEADPAIAEIKWVTGRNAGRFRFVEAGVALRVSELARAEAAVARIEASVREALPQVERVLLHLEPHDPPRLRHAVPLADTAGTLSEHFGEAPYFAIVTIGRDSGAVERQEILANPFRELERGKGLRVAEWLVAQKVDRVVSPKDLAGKGPAFAFREAGVRLERSEAATLAELFAAAGPPGRAHGA